ncbi:MAG: alpha/beta hydrolase [Nitrospinales bacterium]
MFKFFFSLSASLLISGCVSNTNLVKLDSRPGVTQGFIHIMPKELPVASIILFSGGGGQLRLKSATSMAGVTQYSFTAKMRNKFAEHGFQVAVIDSPVDKWGHMSMNRLSEEHITDCKAVATFLKSQVDVPVWIVGTSRSTESIATLAMNSGGVFNGAVFTSSVQEVSYLNLQTIQIPALVVHNKFDGCGVCSPSVAENIYKKLVNSKNRELIWFSSKAKKGPECEPSSPHGFLGIESSVVEAIAAFIKAN